MKSSFARARSLRKNARKPAAARELAGWLGSLTLFLMCAAGLSFATDVVTYHNDIYRTGQNPHETILTQSNVKSTTFGKLFTMPVDNVIDAEPLYLSQVAIPGKGTHNVIYTVTENDSVYAFDADHGTLLWQVSVLGPDETPSGTHDCGQISPVIGITSTPVISRAGPLGTIYLVAMSKNSSTYFQRIHALDVTTGKEQPGSPITVSAKYPGTGADSHGGYVYFDPGQYAERAGLLLLNGVLYTGWTSHCDQDPYTGWIIAYNATTGAQVGVLNLTPNGSQGAIWQAGAGIASDGTSLYLLDANGTFDTDLNAQGFPVNGDYGNAFVKISKSNGKLTVADYFNMYNTVQESNADQDLGSGGAIVLPDITDNNGQVHHLAVGAGKDTNIYVVNRDNMGKWNSTNNSNAYQVLTGVLPGGVWSKPSYFNNTVYYGDVGDHLKAFTFSNAMLGSSPTSQSAVTFPYPGTFPLITSNQGANGIVWAVSNANPAVLYAYDATNLAHELYDSNQAAGGRDQFGPGNKFITPIVANGLVFVGTQTGVAVFGLLH